MTADEISLHSALIFSGHEDISERIMDYGLDDMGAFCLLALVFVEQVAEMLPCISLIRLPVFMVVLCF